MVSMADVRKQFPQYEDVSDGDLLMALHRKFYSDVHPRAFLNSIEGAANAHVTIERDDLKSYWREGVKKPMDGETSKDMSSRLSGDLGVTSNAGPRAVRRGRDVLQGLTFGAGDEIVARGASLLPGRDYETELERERQRLDTGRQMEPGQALAAEIGGAIALPGMGLTGGGSLAVRSRRSAAAGAAGGGAYGFGTGEGGAEARGQNAVQTGLIGAGFGAAAPAVAGAAKRGYDAVRLNRAGRNAARGAPSPDELQSQASQIYQRADQVNNLPRGDLAPRVEGLLSNLQRSGMDDMLTPQASRVADNIADAATSPDPNIGFRELDILRRQAAVPAGDVQNRTQSALGARMQEGIDDFVSEVDPKLSAEVGKAREMWSRLRKNDLVEDVVRKAEMQASGFENGLRIGFRSLLNNKKLSRSFSEAERAAMRQIVEGTTFGNLMKKVGKLGFGMNQQSNMLMGALSASGGAGVGAALGGPAGALVGGVLPGLLGYAGQRASEASTQRAAQRLGAAVRGGGIPSAPQLPAPVMGLLEDTTRAYGRGAVVSSTPR